MADLKDLREPASVPPQRSRLRPFITFAKVAVVLLLTGYVLADIVLVLRGPTGFAFLRDYYLKPSLTAVVRRAHDGAAIIAISGEIADTAGPWFDQVIVENHLQRGDTVLLSSPGGALDTALVLGRVIRAHGFNTAVGTLAADGIAPSYCASACVFLFAGGVERRATAGSRLGIHRFRMPNLTNEDGITAAQQAMGEILAFLAEMGIKPSLAAEATKTDSIRWLEPDEAREMALVTG